MSKYLALSPDSSADSGFQFMQSMGAEVSAQAFGSALPTREIWIGSLLWPGPVSVVVGIWEVSQPMGVHILSTNQLINQT